VNWKPIWIAAACLSLAAGASFGADEPAPAPKAAPAATTQPAAAPTVLASVGDAKIMSDHVERYLADVPPEARVGMRKRIMDTLIFMELVHAYTATLKVECPAEDLAKLKADVAKAAVERKMPVEQFMKEMGLTEDRLRDQVMFKKYADDTTSKEKVAAFVKGNASYFNGTKVQASHVLIKCEPLTSTKDQKAAITKLEKIAADVKAGTTTFEAAAKAHSACPSSAKGGDLGEFTFDRMVPPFAMAAFGMKVGEVSPVVRTRFGFHLIKVTKTTPGSDAATPRASMVAEQALGSVLQNKLFAQALTTCPIVITK
jgi:peptidyl-prolyl cis-trans isomerase C